MRISAPREVRLYLRNRLWRLRRACGGARFEVVAREPRMLALSSDFSRLRISAGDIENLMDSFNAIGLLQAFYRFVGLHVLRRGTYLLHGSAALHKKKGVLFADGGDTTGKTLSSVELGLVSGAYLADEFVFWNSATGEMFSDNDIPIHLRSDVRQHFLRSHHLCVSDEFVSLSELGLVFYKAQHLDIVCYPCYNQHKESYSTPLNLRAAQRRAFIACSAHIAKLLNPRLDRFQFAERRDRPLLHSPGSTQGFHIPPSIRAAIRHGSELLGRNVPAYVLHLKTPCDIPALVGDILKRYHGPH